MTEREKLITEQALSLSASERERLGEALLISLLDVNEQDGTAFREEIQRRREAYKAGEMTARPFEDILRERLAK
jgi:putative addiction module component (TIGR02574 family)